MVVGGEVEVMTTTIKSLRTRLRFQEDLAETTLGFSIEKDLMRSFKILSSPISGLRKTEDNIAL